MNTPPLWLLMIGALVGGLIFSWILIGISAVFMLFRSPQDAFDVNIKDKDGNG